MYYELCYLIIEADCISIFVPVQAAFSLMQNQFWQQKACVSAVSFCSLSILTEREGKPIIENYGDDVPHTVKVLLEVINKA